MTEPTTICGIAGSLRAGSRHGAPPSRRPEPVSDLEDAIRSADDLLLATPEYNHAVPGVMKNLLDRASRPARDSMPNGPISTPGSATTWWERLVVHQADGRQEAVMSQRVLITAGAGGIGFLAGPHGRSTYGQRLPIDGDSKSTA